MRLRVVNILPPGNQLLDRGRHQFAVARLGDQHLRPAGKELRPAALIGFQVGHIRANHAMVRLAARGDGQRIGGRAVEHEEHLALALEDLAQLGQQLGP